MSRRLSCSSLWIVAFALLSTISLVVAAPGPPNLVYALQLQRPPIARVNEPWSWTLYPTTFNASSGSTISLSSINLPTWATFNAFTSTFAGLPNIADLGSTEVTIQANASGVAIGAADSFELIVVEETGPVVRLSIASQIPSASNLGGGGTVVTPDGALRVPPHWSFSLGFQQYTFQTPYYSQIYYTAYETGTTSLPSWLNFDNTTVTFGGNAPEGVGEYSITIFGSNHFGYGDVTQVFKLAVGYHSFELLGRLPAINTTRSDRVNYVIPVDSLRLDNSSISMSNLSSISVDLSLYPYLTYTRETRTIAGTIPSTLQPVNGSIPVIFTDVYNDTATTQLAINVLTSLFMTSNLPTLNLVAGQAFSQNLSNYVSSKIAIYSATFSPSNVTWLTLNPSTLVISGTPPIGIASSIAVQLSALDPTSSITSSASFTINIVLPPSTSTTTSSAAAPTGTTSVDSGAGGSSGLSQAGKLAIAITFGVLGAIIILALIMSYCRRYLSEDGFGRRQRRDSSLLIFDQATITAAQNASVNSRSTKATTVLGTPQGKGEKETSDLGSPHSPVHLTPEMNESSSARRFDLMALLRGRASKKEMPIISLPISQNSLYGLGIGETPRSTPTIAHSGSTEEGRKVMMTTGDSSGARLADAETTSDLERSSSWESQGSSSWFYSEGSDSDGVRRTRKPPSAPRQRRDFLPLPIRRLSPSVSRSTSQPAVRLVPSDSMRSNSDDSSNSDFDSRLFPPPAQSALSSSPHPLASSVSMQDAIGSNESTLDAIEVPTGPPRLIPFLQERRTSDVERAGTKRLSSQIALGSHNSNRDSEVMDAEEVDPHRLSKIYQAPTAPGSPVIAPIYFTTPTMSGREKWLSPNPSEYSDRMGSEDGEDGGDGIRLIGSTASSPYMHDTTSTAAFTSTNYASGSGRGGHRRTMTSSSYGSARDDAPGEIALLVGEPFRFTPRLNPAPSISTQARGGNAPRATYFAVIDRPDNKLLDRAPLPPWCQFDSVKLEISGAPRLEDVGFLHLQIIERKMVSGSPRRGGEGEEREIEEVVGRYVLEVSGDQKGVWTPIVY